MLPESPLLNVLTGRIHQAIRRLGDEIWEDSVPLENVTWSAPSPAYRTFAEAALLPRKPVQAPLHWGPLYAQAWFQAKLPPQHGARPRWLVWQDQGEATLYLDGQPYAGLDGPHPRVRLPKKAGEIWIEAICLENTVWSPNLIPAITGEGVPFRKISLCHRNDEAWHGYHDFKVLFDLLHKEHRLCMPRDAQFPNVIGYQHPVDRVTVLYRRLMRELDRACAVYEAQGVAALRKVLATIYRSLPAHPESLRAVLTGHAHIDLVWLWPERTADFKAVHSFATALHLMDEYPEFRFGYSQPASYESAERCAPGLLKRVQSAIRRGQWDATGASYVESDTLLPCGEALARSVMVGQQEFQRIRGTPARLMWLPDVFGYSGCLPQILRQCGVDYFFTTKLHWSAVTIFPHSSFVWKGNDGTEVLAHLSQGVGYNGTTNIDELVRGQEEYRQSDVHDAFLAPTGLGDGGGGPTADDIERSRRLSNLASSPRTEWGNLETFFDELNGVRPSLPDYQGELYLEYHRGTYTTHGDIKALFRALERSVQKWEAVRCAAGGGNIDRVTWKRLIFAQFHDYIPGSSIHEVYGAARQELAKLIENAETACQKELTGKGSDCLFNPLPYIRTWSVNGGTCQLPPLSGSRVADLTPVQHPPVQVEKNALDNGIVQAGFDRLGRISRLSVRGQEIALRGPLGELAFYPDNPGLFEAWDIDRGSLSNGTIEQRAPKCSVETHPDGSATCAFSRPLAARSSVTTRYTLHPAETVLRVEYELDWQEERVLLKALFPSAYAGEHARFGAPFGSVLRHQRGGAPEAEAKWEVPGSRYAIALDDSGEEGFFMVTEAKYGWTARNGDLQLSLVRSAFVTQANVHRGLRPELPDCQVSDQGKHLIRLAIRHYHSKLMREEQPAALADLLFTEPLPYRGQPLDAGFLGLEGGESLQPCWAKPSDDGKGWILRLHETLGRRGTATLRLAKGRVALRTDLSEKTFQPLTSTEVTFGPYELISLRIT